MRKSYQDYKQQGKLKIKHFIFNTIYDTNTVSFEEIYQLSENFVHLNDTKKLNKKIINYMDRYLSKYEEQLQHTITCSTKRIITLNEAIQRLKKCQLALYPLITRNAADPDFVNSYCHDYMTSYISNHLESIQNDTIAFLGSENSIQKFTFISETVKICKTFGLYSEISKIMVDVNVATNIKKLHCIFDRDALESIDYIANYFAELRKMDHLREFMYDIEKDTLQNILKNISAFDKKVFSDTIRFYHLFSFYFTANMKSEFFTHLSAHLNTFWISHDDNVLNRLYRCIVSAIRIIKNTDYNSEVVDFVDQYLTGVINDDVNLPRFLIEKMNECLLANSTLHEHYFLVHLIDTENHTSMRTYKKEAEHYLQKYSTICDTNDCFELSYDIFYYIVANLKEKSQFMSAYETYTASRLLFASDYIEKENKMIDSYKPYTTYNHFYKVERMIKDLQNIYRYKNAEIYTLNSYLWRVAKTFDFEPANELNEIIESFLETKDTDTFTYRFAWNLSQCDVEIDGHDITMSVIQYQIIKYVMNTQLTKKELQNQFKSCDISLGLDALCKYGFLVILDDRYHFSNSFDREVKNVMPLECGNVANLFDSKKEINNSCIIESKILLNVKREKSIKEKKLVELVARSLNMKEGEVRIVIDTLKQNGKIVVNNDAIIVVNGK